MPRGRRALCGLLGLLVAVVVTHPARALESESEQAAWSRARGAGTVAAFQRYLKDYPTGRHAEAAFRTIVEAARTSAPPAPAGADARLSASARAQISSAAQSLY